MRFSLHFFAVIACLISFSAQGIETEQHKTEEARAEAISDLKFEVDPGEYSLPGAHQTFKLPVGWSFYKQAEAHKLHPLIRGIEAPAEVVAIAVDERDQLLIFSYYELGFVKDYDWQYLNAGTMLEGITDKYEEINLVQKKNNMPGFKVKGWLLEPTYLSAAKTAYWAIEYEYDEQILITGGAMKLGRNGYTFIEWGGAAVTEFSSTDNPLITALSGLKFDEGFRYSDYSYGDTLSDGGLAELLASAGNRKGADEVSLAYTTSTLAYRFWIVILAAIIALLSRGVLLRRLNKTMLSESKKAKGYSDDETGIKEEVAPQELAVIEANVETGLPGSTPNREKLLKQAKKAINLVFVANLIIGAVYAAAYYLVLDDKQRIVSHIPSLGDAGKDAAVAMILKLDLYLYLIVFFLIWNTMRFLGERNQLSAYGKGPLGFLKPVAAFIFKFFHSSWCKALGWIVLLYTLYILYILTVVFFMHIPGLNEWLLVVAVVLHLFLWYLLKKIGRKRINTKLLILRVFLIGKTSAFTFRGLAKSWKHFGSYFTVADPSFYKVAWKQRFNYIFPLYIILLFLFYTALVDPNREIEDSLFIGFIFLLVIGNILFIIFGSVKMKQKFMSNAAALDKRLKKLERAPTTSDNTFRPEPVMCYDNTWKLAVDGLISSADVVLMDLRGFSETNKGCAYEVNVLFDSKPASKIVFMGYKDAIPLIRNLIKAQWAKLSEKSPNLSLKNPYTTLYTVTKEDNKDIQGITDALLESAVLDFSG